jgi:polysaccharide export outer membrane protein
VSRSRSTPALGRRTGLASLLLLLPALLGCTRGGVHRHPDDVRRLIADGQAAPEVRFAPVADAERPALLGEHPDTTYRLGIGDVLQVQADLPFLEGFGESRAGDVTGTHVKPDGQIYLPQIGGVPAAGRTVIEIQDDLRERLSKFRENPYVSVDVLEYRSQQYYVLGEVTGPGVFPVNGMTTLLGAVAGAGGFTPKAQIRTAYVLRKGRVLPLSLADLIVRGDLTRNVYMQDQDIVLVPSYEDAKVYVVGEVQEPGVMPMEKGEISLAAAIAAAGGFKFETADHDSIRVFRGSWQNPTCYTISACELYLYGEGIRLQDGDRIIVAPTAQASYKRTLDLTLPYVLSMTSTALALSGLAVALK